MRIFKHRRRIKIGDRVRSYDCYSRDYNIVGRIGDMSIKCEDKFKQQKCNKMCLRFRGYPKLIYCYEEKWAIKRGG